MQLIDNIPVWGSPVDEGAFRQIRNCAREADRVALMADHHLGYAVPIGGVVAYADSISPSGVGYDIACGNKAVLTDAYAPEVRKNISRLMDDVWNVISFGIGRNNEDEKVDHALFDDPAWSIKAVAPLKQMARNQLGTVGSGNHYVDIFSDEQDRIWIGVHFGSRGLGHKTATFFLKAAGAKDGMEADPCVIPARSDLGIDYLECMRLGGLYAYAGRDWVCGRVARVLGASILQSPQFRMARTPQGCGPLGGSQGRDSGISRPEGIRRRHNGRAVRYPRRRGKRTGSTVALFNHSRRGPNHGPYGGAGKGR
jgi:tRNA-splicing ligase RtcB